MPCYGPIRVGIRRHSAVVGAGKVTARQEVPCGRCLGCRAEQGRQWMVRMMHEAQVRKNAWFVTLTYDDEHLPEFEGLHPPDLQGFFKSLRKDYGPGEIAYYACGEYGETTLRPHYHAVLFGPELLDRYLFDDSGKYPVWKSPHLERHWKYGLVDVGTVTKGSASYVAGYVRKKVGARENPDRYLRVQPYTGEIREVVPEFSRMSRRPAIGKKWIERYWRDVYPRDYVVVDGVRSKPPRFYDKWMDANEPLVMEEVREKRWQELEEVSKYTLAAKKAIHQSRVGLFERRASI